MSHKSFKINLFLLISNEDELKIYADLRDKSIITEEEFQANPKPSPLRYSSIDFGYGTCTKDGWLR